MKKIVFLFICIFININVFADEIKVEFSKCVDGDTAKFIYKNEVITARFLAIDTPESVHPTIGEEPFGKDASNFTCNTLEKADEIVLEFDSNSDKTDKYDRYLVWVFVDGKLLQKELISKGYAEVAYLYDDYKYTKELEILINQTIKKVTEDIDNMKYEGGGGTDFDVAVSAFSKRVDNKIIFTDGYADMPREKVKAIWVVFGNTKINPNGGKVIYIDKEQFDKLSYEESNKIKKL